MQTPAAFEAQTKPPRKAGRFALRFWAIRNARLMEILWQGMEKLLPALDPVFRRVGYQRLERPAAAIERTIKGALFDCRMCGKCVLSSTGMSCPMNCPKGLRNGPCGGVRANGNCEVYPDMPCVWVKAYEGAARMKQGGSIATVQVAVDHRLKGRSSWLAVARGEHAAHGKAEGKP